MLNLIVSVIVLLSFWITFFLRLSSQTADCLRRIYVDENTYLYIYIIYVCILRLYLYAHIYIYVDMFSNI